MSYPVRVIEISSDAHALFAVTQAKGLVIRLGFSEGDQTKIAITISELTRNIVDHAQGKGRITIKSIQEPRVGIEIVAEDKGPGITDVEKALQGRSDTKKGLGMGLGAAKRLMDEFTVETRVGEGTTVTVRKWLH